MRATNIANWLGSKGYKVTILVTKGIAEEIFFELNGNVSLVSLDEYVTQKKIIDETKKDALRRQKKIRSYKRLRYITKFIKKWDWILQQNIRGIRRSETLRKFMLGNTKSTVVCFGLPYYEMAYYATKGLGCRLIFAEKNASELECPKDPAEKEAIFKLLGKADAAILQTKDERDFYGDCLKNAFIIHNPIKVGLPDAYEGERRKVAVNFCRISPQKNLTLLLNAFVRVHNEFPEYTLEIYGNAVEKEEEAERDYLKKTASENGWDEFIHILPPARDVHTKIKDCAMFVSSSDFEGLSNSMIEAMALGLPCICTDCLGGGAGEVITNMENGILVPVKDEDALYKGIKAFITDKKLAEKCGNNSQKIKSELSIDNIGEQWLNVIKINDAK